MKMAELPMGNPEVCSAFFVRGQEEKGGDVRGLLVKQDKAYHLVIRASLDFGVKDVFVFIRAFLERRK